MTEEIAGEMALIVSEAECGVCRRLKQGISADDAWAEGFAIACRTMERGAALCQRHNDLTAQKLRDLGMKGAVAPNAPAARH